MIHIQHIIQYNIYIYFEDRTAKSHLTLLINHDVRPGQAAGRCTSSACGIHAFTWRVQPPSGFTWDHPGTIGKKTLASLISLDIIRIISCGFRFNFWKIKPLADNIQIYSIITCAGDITFTASKMSQNHQQPFSDVEETHGSRTKIVITQDRTYPLALCFCFLSWQAI